MALFRVLQIGQLTILISWPISAVNSNRDFLTNSKKASPILGWPLLFRFSIKICLVYRIPAQKASVRSIYLLHYA